MAKFRITPTSVLLTSGQAATFEAFEDDKPVKATWRFDVPPNQPPPTDAIEQLSALYVAPAVTAARNVVAIAERGGQLASATITLTPDSVAIVPAEVELTGGQTQKFLAIVPGQPAPAVTWILSPPVGALKDISNDSVVYEAPDKFEDDAIVRLIASTPLSATPARATVKLNSPPWTGPGVQLLGTFLLLVFCLVFLLISLWPPALPSPDAARADRISAERSLDDKTHLLDAAELAVAEAKERAQADAEKRDEEEEERLKQKNANAEAQRKANGGVPATASANRASTVNPPAASNDAPDGGAPAAPIAAEVPKPPAPAGRVHVANQQLERATVARADAWRDLQAKLSIEAEVNSPNVTTRLVPRINREVDLLWLVLCAGGLGGFLHMAQSYGEYIGNRTLKSRWAWWYSFRPFIGAALAVVVYAAIRGGFMAVATGSNAKASELNPFGLVSIAAMVGMFSRAATIKLGEVFDTLFKSDKSKTADKLVDPQPPTASATVQVPVVATAAVQGSIVATRQ